MLVEIDDSELNGYMGYSFYSFCFYVFELFHNKKLKIKKWNAWITGGKNVGARDEEQKKVIFMRTIANEIWKVSVKY